MAEKTLQFISTKMKNLDICMLTTTSAKGILSARPMSNNGDGKYEGDSYFFSYGGSQKIKDIEKDASVNLSFIASGDLYIAVEGKAKLIRSRNVMEPHWVPSLKTWFEDGPGTEGIYHDKSERKKNQVLG
jgi:general stress protein 26